MQQAHLVAQELRQENSIAHILSVCEYGYRKTDDMRVVLQEWRAKCISLAQRLEKTEAEIPNPRPQDVEEIKQLESQVSTDERLAGRKKGLGQKTGLNHFLVFRKTRT